MGASFLRIAKMLGLMIPLVVVVCGILILLPHFLSFVALLVGLVLFKVGSHFHRLSITALGGAMMFGGVLAWALVEAKII